MNSDVERLSGLLSALANMLGAEHEHWRVRILAARDLIDRDDRYGAEKFVGLFGGMGSLNDLWFDDEEKRRAFSRLSSSAYALAEELLRGD
jgi:hypothetical protein